MAGRTNNIDFTSTKTGVDLQETACARLLTAVIYDAIKSACKPIGKHELKVLRNLNQNAREALAFIFGTQNPTFAEYAELIGSSAEDIRNALIREREIPENEPRNGITERKRRSLLNRLLWSDLIYRHRIGITKKED